MKETQGCFTVNGTGEFVISDPVVPRESREDMVLKILNGRVDFGSMLDAVTLVASRTTYWKVIPSTF